MKLFKSVFFLPNTYLASKGSRRHSAARQAPRKDGKDAVVRHCDRPVGSAQDVRDRKATPFYRLENRFAYNKPAFAYALKSIKCLKKALKKHREK